MGYQMTGISVEQVDSPSLSQYKTCEKCNAPFEKLYIGGDGDWRQTLMCEMCFHVRRAIPLKVIWELIAKQYDMSVEAAKKADETSQRAYQAVLAKHAVSPTGGISG
jgi:hypothetical protein